MALAILTVVRPFGDKPTASPGPRPSGVERDTATVASAAGLRGVAFHPNSQVVAAVGDDEAWTWSQPDRRPGPAVAIRGCGGSDLAYLPDGRTLAIACRDRTVRLWQPADGTVAVVATAHRDMVMDLDISADGRLVATAGLDGLVQVVDVAAREAVGPPIDVELAVPGTRRSIGVTAVAFNPDGSMLATAGARTVTIWDLHSRDVVRRIDVGATVLALAYSPDGQLLATGDDRRTVQLWTVADGSRAATPLTGHTGAVYGVAFSRDGRRLASGDVADRVAWWDVTAARQIGTTRTGGPTLAVSPDGSTVATYTRNSSVLLLVPTASFDRRRG